MVDKAKMVGFLGLRGYRSENRPQHRRKGGCRRFTNRARREIDKKLCMERAQ